MSFASARLVEQISPSLLPLWLRAGRSILPPELRGALMHRYNDIPGQSDEWEVGFPGE